MACPGGAAGANLWQGYFHGRKEVDSGVPTVVDASAFSDSPDAAGMFVTPRDIDASVRDVAKLIGYGINLALHDGLTVADIDMLKS